MQLTRSRDFTINMGNNSFESVRIGVTVTIDHTEVPEGADIYKAADVELTRALADEVAYFSDLTEKRDSFIHTVNDDNESLLKESGN